MAPPVRVLYRSADSRVNASCWKLTACCGKNKVCLLEVPYIHMATSENPKIKACDRAESGVYTEVNEHFGEGA